MALADVLNGMSRPLQAINDFLEDALGVNLAPVRGAVAALGAVLLQTKVDALTAAQGVGTAATAAVQQGIEHAQQNPDAVAGALTDAAGVPWLAPLLVGVALTLKRRRRGG